MILGVCERLREEFGETVKIYTDNSVRKTGALDSKSSLREPNFYVNCKIPRTGKIKDRHFTSTQMLGNRYLRSAGLCIECRWFDDWQAVLDRLFLCLEYINIGNNSVVRGSSMQGEYADDKEAVLNFFVNYDVFVEQVQEKVKMEKFIKEDTFIWH
jgi:hypothetical protein